MSVITAILGATICFQSEATGSMDLDILSIPQHLKGTKRQQSGQMGGNI